MTRRSTRCENMSIFIFIFDTFWESSEIVIMCPRDARSPPTHRRQGAHMTHSKSDLLGRLEPISLREIWASKASNFTPWLAREDNIALSIHTSVAGLQSHGSIDIGRTTRLDL